MQLSYWVRILVPTPLLGSTVKPAIRMRLFALEEYAHPVPSKLVRKNKTTSGTVIFVWVSWQPLSDLQARFKTQGREILHDLQDYPSLLSSSCLGDIQFKFGLGIVWRSLGIA